MVVPSYQEGLAIEPNIERLVAALEQLDGSWELLIVNDGSTDDSLEKMQRAAAKDPRIRVLSYPVNRGRGHALRTGFAAATGDFVVATESDLNWGTDIVGQLVAALEKTGADVVIASPHAPGGGMENVPFVRWFISWAGNKVFGLAFPGVTMATGMTRGYRREVLESLDLESDDKELHVEILYKALDLGFRVAEIPATLAWKKPEKGEKVRKSHFKSRMLMSHLLLSFGIRPFILYGTIGLLMGLFGLLAIGYLYSVSFSGHPVGGRPLFTVATLSILVGAQIILFGFLANQNRALRRQMLRIQRDLTMLRRGSSA